jgi:hypothetical protein
MDLHYHAFPMNFIRAQSQIDSIGRFLLILFAALVLLAFCIVYFGPSPSRNRAPVPDQERDPLLVRN